MKSEERSITDWTKHWIVQCHTEDCKRMGQRLRVLKFHKRKVFIRRFRGKASVQWKKNSLDTSLPQDLEHLSTVFTLPLYPSPIACRQSFKCCTEDCKRMRQKAKGTEISQKKSFIWRFRTPLFSLMLFVCFWYMYRWMLNCSVLQGRLQEDGTKAKGIEISQKKIFIWTFRTPLFTGAALQLNQGVIDFKKKNLYM